MSSRPPPRNQPGREKPELRLEGLHGPTDGMRLLRESVQMLKLLFFPVGVLVQAVVRTLGWGMFSLLLGLVLMVSLASALLAALTLAVMVLAHVMSWKAWNAFVGCSVVAVASAAFAGFAYHAARQTYASTNAHLGRDGQDFDKNISAGSEWVLRMGRWWNRPMKIYERQRRAEMDERLRQRGGGWRV